MKYSILALVALMTGCSAMPDLKPQVSINIACDEMRGKIGSSCDIKAPSDAYVSVNGESINIEFKGRK